MQEDFILAFDAHVRRLVLVDHPQPVSLSEEIMTFSCDIFPPGLSLLNLKPGSLFIDPCDPRRQKHSDGIVVHTQRRRHPHLT